MRAGRHFGSDENSVRPLHFAVSPSTRTRQPGMKPSITLRKAGALDAVSTVRRSAIRFTILACPTNPGTGFRVGPASTSTVVDGSKELPSRSARSEPVLRVRPVVRNARGRGAGTSKIRRSSGSKIFWRARSVKSSKPFSCRAATRETPEICRSLTNEGLPSTRRSPTVSDARRRSNSRRRSASQAYSIPRKPPPEDSERARPRGRPNPEAGPGGDRGRVPARGASSRGPGTAHSRRRRRDYRPADASGADVQACSQEGRRDRRIEILVQFEALSKCR